MAQTFALARPVLHRVSYGNQTVTNASKFYETHQNVSLWYNGVDRMLSSRKIPTRLHGTNFCTSSARFAPSFLRQPNGPECTQIVRNAPQCQFTVQWGGSDAFSVKNSDATSRMHTNSTKRTKTSVRGPTGWIGCVRCEKFDANSWHELLH